MTTNAIKRRVHLTRRRVSAAAIPNTGRGQEVFVGIEFAMPSRNRAPPPLVLRQAGTPETGLSPGSLEDHNGLILSQASLKW